MAYRKDWGQPQTGNQGFAGTAKTIGRVVSMAAADLVTGNTVGAFKVPAGFQVTGIIAVSSDLDTGTNAMTLSVGDAASGTRYLSGAALGQSAGQTVTALASTGLLFLNSVETEILITVTLGPTVAAAGTVALYLTGFIAQ
jgi:hypothetical protein